MAFRTNPAPYQRSKNSTLKIMLILLAALVVVWAFSIVYSFKLDETINAYILKANKTLSKKDKIAEVAFGIKSILNVVLAVGISILCDVVISIVKQLKKDHKVSIKEVARYFLHNYSYITGIIFALTLPVYTSYYIIIIGSLFATLVCKSVFGGFGKNVFNPAVMARLFVGLCFGGALGIPEIITKVAAASKEAFAIDAVTGATITSAFKNTFGWISTSIPLNATVIEDVLVEGFTIKDLLMGNYLGAMGETFTLVIFVLGIILSVVGVINWRTPVFYLGTVALSALAIALFTGLNPGLYVLAHLSLGGLMFGAVFMLTDPVTGPTSSYGKTICAIFAGLMTVLIRIKGNYPEGVAFSIALANLISPFIDHVLSGKTNKHYVFKVSGLGVAMILVAVFTSAVAIKQVDHVGINDAYGINYAERNTLTTLVTLEDGEHIERGTDYVVKTSKVVDYTFDAKTKDILNKVYLVKDSNGTVTKYCYIVSDSYEIVKKAWDEELNDWETFGTETITCYAMVTISSEGKLVQFASINNTSPSTPDSGYMTSAASHASTLIGKTETEVANSASAVTGLSYSPAFIKILIADAYAEFNAK